MKKQGHHSLLLLHFLVSLFTPLFLQAQHAADSLKVNMQPLIVEENFFTPLEMAKLQVQDSGIVLSKTLTLSTLHSSDWINRSHPGISVKNYGPSSSSTLSVKGSSANQTQLVWHHLNINQSWQSLSDLSLIASGFFNGIQLSSSVLSGLEVGITPGANLLLQSKKLKKNQTWLEIAYTGGSFGLNKGITSFGIDRKRWNSSTSIQFFNAQNNFPYTNKFKKDHPIETLPHAANQHLTILNEIEIKVDTFQRIELGAWLVRNYRELPPTMLMSSSAALQKDQSIRGYLSWNFHKRIWKGFHQIAYLNDFLLYVDSIAQLNETNRCHNAQILNSWQVQLHPKIELQIGEQTQYIYLKSEAYAGSHSQFNHSLFGGLSYSGLSHFLNLSVRQEIRKKNWAPTGVGLTAIYYTKWFSLQLIANKVYRAPSYNDLFWIPGGNPNLKSENGYTLDVGISTKNKNGYWPIFNASGYSKWINNWIQWLPNGTIWTPLNTKSVRALGGELSLKKSVYWAKLHLQFGAGIHLNKTFSRETNSSNESNGLQLIYVPNFKSNSFISIDWKNYFVSIDLLLYGKTYTSTDHSSKLPAFCTLNASVAKTFHLFPKTDIQLSFSVNNATNASYQTVEQRPMPGVNFLGGFLINFSNQ